MNSPRTEADHWPRDNYCPMCLRGWDDDDPEAEYDACPYCGGHCDD